MLIQSRTEIKEKILEELMLKQPTLLSNTLVYSVLDMWDNIPLDKLNILNSILYSYKYFETSSFNVFSGQTTPEMVSMGRQFIEMILSRFGSYNHFLREEKRLFSAIKYITNGTGIKVNPVNVRMVLFAYYGTYTRNQLGYGCVVMSLCQSNIDNYPRWIAINKTQDTNVISKDYRYMFHVSMFTSAISINTKLFARLRYVKSLSLTKDILHNVLFALANKIVPSDVYGNFIDRDLVMSYDLWGKDKFTTPIIDKSNHISREELIMIPKHYLSSITFKLMLSNLGWKLPLKVVDVSLLYDRTPLMSLIDKWVVDGKSVNRCKRLWYKIAKKAIKEPQHTFAYVVFIEDMFGPHVFKVLEKLSVMLGPRNTLQLYHLVYNGFVSVIGTKRSKDYVDSVSSFILGANNISKDTLSTIVKNWTNVRPLLEEGVPLNECLRQITFCSYTNVIDESLAYYAGVMGIDNERFGDIQATHIYLMDALPNTLYVPAPIKASNEKFRVELMPKEDPRCGLIGEFTDCCQTYRDIGHACAVHSVKSPYGALWVMFDNKTNEIVSCSWVWVNNDRLVLDNIEGLPKKKFIPQAKDAWLKACKSVKGKLGIKSVYIGTRNAFNITNGKSSKRTFEIPDYSITNYTDSKEIMRVKT